MAIDYDNLIDDLLKLSGMTDAETLTQYNVDHKEEAVQYIIDWFHVMYGQMGEYDDYKREALKIYNTLKK